jgi:hypothetical protein
MATEINDITLTDRSGCRDLTLDATSCTHIESEMRCAILSNNLTNSNIPDFCPVECLDDIFVARYLKPRRDLLHLNKCSDMLLRKDIKAESKELNVEGTAANSTDTVRTMPISSSSEILDSFAASSNSLAIPNETENARSEPNDPSAPEVVIESINNDNTCSSLGTISSSEVRRATRQVCVLSSAIACQQGLSLCVRHLLINPDIYIKTDKNGRYKGSKATRQRVGNTHNHFFDGSVYGCLLSEILEFVKRPDEKVTEITKSMKHCMEIGLSCLSKCKGSDVNYLLRGLGYNYILRGQLLYMNNSKNESRMNFRYVNKSAVIGISACVYFTVYALSNVTDNAASILFAFGEWLDDSYQRLKHWLGSSHALGTTHRPELMAELRSLERCRVALVNAKQHARHLGLDTYNSVKMCIEYIQKAMWPQGRLLDKSSQPALLKWISSDEFHSNFNIHPVQRPNIRFAFNVPISQIQFLVESKTNKEYQCSESTCESTITFFSKSSKESDC